MLDLRKVAVTGGLCCGKTRFCRYLQELGAKVVDADAIVHGLLSPNTDLGKKIVELLGADSVVGKEFDRKVIAEKVFLDSKKLQQLEWLLHLPTFVEIRHRYEHENDKDNDRVPLFVAEIPLLFEVGGENYFDITIAVTASEQLCQQRYHDLNDYKKRMQQQLPLEEKIEKADLVVANDGTLDQLQDLAKDIFVLLTAE